MNNVLLDSFSPYPFIRLANLLPGLNTNPSALKMYIGEPVLPPPSYIGDLISKYNKEFGIYPKSKATPDLTQAIYRYLNRRYNTQGLSINPENQILPTVGSKEGIYFTGHLLAPYASDNPEKNICLIPNPMYQVYKNMAILNKYEPYYMPAFRENQFQPDITELPENILKKTKLAIICNPSNPQGACISKKKLVSAIETSRKYNFVLLIDECYTDLYYNNTPAIGTLDALTEASNKSLDNIIISNTLSKRTSCVGLRSGFLVGGVKLMKDMFKLRNSVGPVMPIAIEHVSAKLWDDEEFVAMARNYYQQNVDVAQEVFGNYEGYMSPEAAIYLWIPVKNDEQATLKIWNQLQISVLPGSYLTHGIEGEKNPGSNYIRITINHPAEIYKNILPKIKKCLIDHC